MKAGIKLALIIVSILLGGLIFDLANSGLNVQPSEYAHVSLTLDEQFQAINEARKQKYLTEAGYYHQFFPLQRHILLGADTYIWFVMEKLGYLAMIWVILWMTTIIGRFHVRMGKMLKIPTVGYLLLMVGDLCDFLLDYNNLEYGKVLGLPVTYNTLSFLTYVIFVFHQFVKHGGSDLRSNSVSSYGRSHDHY